MDVPKIKTYFDEITAICISLIFMGSAVVLPALLADTSVSAAGQVTSRSIEMSDSSTSATGVSYLVSFTTTAAFSSMVIDFCTSSPIVGDSGTCTTTDTPSLQSATLSSSVGTGNVKGWTTVAIGASPYNNIKLAQGSGTAGTSGAQQFQLNNVTNSATLGTFYARITTYSNTTYGTPTAYSTPAAPGSYVDYGGIALSTANTINITAKVQESLTFCVYTTGSTCAGASGTAIALGDGNGVLSTAGTVYTSTAAKFNVATNAQVGTSIAMKGDTLKSGANAIAASGATCATDTTPPEFFGMRISTAGSGVTAQLPYNCGSGSHGFDITSGVNVTSTYGDPIALLTGPTAEVQSTMEFAAKAAATTRAGIYTNSLAFIATSTY